MRTPFPQSFWVRDNLLCAGSYPGDLDERKRDAKLRGLLDCGIRRVIDLMDPEETNFSGQRFERYYDRLDQLGRERGISIEVLNIPIRDRHAPSKADMRKILGAIDAGIREGKPTFLHCWGGHGRTGTVVACYLIENGLTPDEAIADVCALRANLPKNHRPFEGDQEDFVRSWFADAGNPSDGVIEAVLKLARDGDQGEALIPALTAEIRRLIESRGRGDGRRVGGIEAEVMRDPVRAFAFDADGNASLRTALTTLPAGRFETPSIGELKARAKSAGRKQGRAKLWVLHGTSPATDIGSLQATAGSGMLFQVASQFNCLEAPSPERLATVTDYFRDNTQGPRASISAYSGTLLRHYAAPGPNGERFTQKSGGPQIDLLADVCGRDIARVRNGYLTSDTIGDPRAFRQALRANFDNIRVGVHDNVPVLLGYDWNGAVSGDRRIGQVFTSTFAKAYGPPSIDAEASDEIMTTLLRGAYLGTLLAGVVFARPRVVLTLIGGGVFGNPIRAIWDAINWAIAETEPFVSGTLDVIVNTRSLGDGVSMHELANAAASREGAVVSFSRDQISLVGPREDSR